jgi:hypothetical protein
MSVERDSRHAESIAAETSGRFCADQRVKVEIDDGLQGKPFGNSVMPALRATASVDRPAGPDDDRRTPHPLISLDAGLGRGSIISRFARSAEGHRRRVAMIVVPRASVTGSASRIQIRPRDRNRHRQPPIQRRTESELSWPGQLTLASERQAAGMRQRD